MNKPKLHLDPDCWHIPAACASAVGGGFLLSAGTVSGVTSPLAAALAGIVSPLYALGLLLGSLLCYGVRGAPAGMQFLLLSLLGVTCIRIFLREERRPWILALTTALSCIIASFVQSLVFETGYIPVSLFASFLTGIAAYFLADARDTLTAHRRIVLHAGKTFTFSLCGMLCVTALCGLDTPFFNVGRIAALSVTLLFARQLRHTGGTLMGALTTCGVTLCSVPLGTPMLFLPVTGMMAGFCAGLPQILYIPVFFMLQALSTAVLDGSRGFVREMTELAISCGVYVLLTQIDLHRFLLCGDAEHAPSAYHRERFVGDAVRSLREETSEVMHRLTLAPPEDDAVQVRERLCTGCKNHSYCWSQRGMQTAEAMRTLVRDPRRNTVPEPLDGCIRRTSLLEECTAQATRSALSRMQRVHMLQSRQVTLEHLQLLEDVTSGLTNRRDCDCLAPQTDALRRILHQCAAAFESCEVRRLRTGRTAAEIFTKMAEFPVTSVQTLLGKYLRLPLEQVRLETGGGMRICLYEAPPYRLEYAMHSENAPAHERCGDHSDAFTDATGDQYLVLSDGMGSGSTASLASRIAVRTFRRMVESGMDVPTAIRLVNSMLLTETNTENFATLDVLQFHADCGEISLYKSGAAATLLCHAGKVQRISSMSFPVGIVTDALPSRRRSTAFAGDTVVMLSDGIGEAEYPYISQLLREQTDPDALVRTACDKCTLFHGGQSRDDVTVIAARVTSRIRADYTKIDETDSTQCDEFAPALSKSL